uniref:ClpX-type ZB domain-containing protein n=1 Tax=Morganella morganii TaxID=582 RepID=A0AAI9HVF4_MORMO|nr:hypothetical protein [Morganella morganii]
MTSFSGTGMSKVLYCSFCGKSKDETPVLIAGPSVYICGECIGLCNEIVEEKQNLTEIEQLDKNAAEVYRFISRSAGGAFNQAVLCPDSLLRGYTGLDAGQIKTALKLLTERRMIKVIPYGRAAKLYLLDGGSSEIKFDEQIGVYSVKANVLVSPDPKIKLFP